MAQRRRLSESVRPPDQEDMASEDAPDLMDIMVRSDSLDSLSSCGNSDGGPCEPTPAEISLLSASIDCRNIEVAKSSNEIEAVINAAASETVASAASETTDEECEEVAHVFPAGFHRLPSAMRPPVRRGHVRSASAGGAAVLNFRPTTAATALQRNNSSAVDNAATHSQLPQTTKPFPVSVLKSGANTVAARSVQRQHRRVFSHGHITFGGHEIISANNENAISDDAKMPPLSDGLASSTTSVPPGSGGHRRTASKTDFILPPDHEERERKRNSLQRQTSADPNVGRQRQGSGFHRRHDSLAFSFRGHSRQASRTDSIYTLRAQGYTSSNWTCKDRLCGFWSRCKRSNETNLGLNGNLNILNGHGGQAALEDRVRILVPNHTIPSDVPEDKHPNAGYANNEIRTTKYTLWTFLPKNLFEQFHRFANIYFLFIVILNWVPAISAFGREISMLPVIFVLGVTAIKDIFEDRRRYLSDKRVNFSTCRVYKGGRYVKTLWKDLKVGDMVHLSCNERIPADILVLRSSDEHGLCYIDTQNLDGEANLKQREVPRGFVDRQGAFQPQDFRSTVECDMPTTKIYRFNGFISHENGEKVPVGKDNLLLRECMLKNTTFVEGLVVYAGKDSKAMLNNGGPRYKRSKLEVQMNHDVVWCVMILIILCLIGAIGTSTWLSGFSEYVPFLSTLTFEETQPGFDGFLVFWTFVIMLQVIIPMSLYVTIEMTKLLQIYLIHQDLKLYDESTNRRVECRALNIPEELGQIQYVFCDKTGTLTENNMVFKRCTIGGQDFAHNTISTNRLSTSMASLQQVANTPTGRAMIPVNPTLADRLSSMDIQLLIEGKDLDLKMHPQAGLTQDFFLLLAVCNTVIVAKHPHKDTMNASGVVLPVDGPGETPKFETDSVHAAPLNPDPSLTPKRAPRYQFNNPLSPIASSPETSPTSTPRPKHLQLPSILTRFMSGTSLNNSKLNNQISRSLTPTPCELRPIYEAESPDELALVDAAFAYNCKLLKRSPHHAVVSLPGEGLIEFEVLHVLPFDSNRKRMSIILRHPVTKSRILFCKGADSAIFPKLKEAKVGSEDEARLEKTQHHLNMYAKQGLRVLVMAKRILSEDEYQDWLKGHLIAETSLHMREKLLMDSYRKIETHLTLLGATGIEDKLQDGVPETISNLRSAGIVVWVLTGDKQETAINIAYSCKLFTQNMEIIKLNSRSRDGAEHIIKSNLDEIQALNKDEDIRKQNRALVVDGKTLVYILDKRAKLQQAFLELTSHCAAVLGCRATPLQKAYIVRIVKEELGMHTLAIGDGANDVSMIQTADVGVGISGMEGRQAVMASDFAISKFKYLERLLLVHGHWNYDRLARMVLYFFYKNAAFVFVTFWFQLFNGFSGSIMFDHMYLMLYNLLWTSLPPMAIGVLDQDAPDCVLSAKPQLYSRGRSSLVYKPYSFWLNMLDALYQSFAIFFIAFGAYQGSDVGLWEFGTAVLTSSLCVMLIHLALETKSWTIMHWTSLMLSILFYFAFILVYNSFCITCFGLQNPFWVIQVTMGTLEFWLVCLLTSVLALIPRVVCLVIKNCTRPDAVTAEMMSRNSKSHFVTGATSRGSTITTSTSWSRGPSQNSKRPSEQREHQTATEMTAIIP